MDGDNCNGDGGDDAKIVSRKRERPTEKPPRMSATAQERHRAGATPHRSDTMQQRYFATVPSRNRVTAQERHRAVESLRNNVAAQQRFGGSKDLE